MANTKEQQAVVDRIKARKTAPKRKRKPKSNGSKREGYEVIFLRLRPEVKEALEATVEGMNANRRPGDPAYSVTGVIMMAIANTLGTDVNQGKLKLVRGVA